MSDDVHADLLRLMGMVFYGHHGVTDEEQHHAQKFVVDMIVTTDLAGAAAEDDIDQTVDYAGLFGIAKSVILGPSVRLLETLAEKIAAKTLKYSPKVARVRVSVKKVHPPLNGELDWAGVEIERSR